MTSVQIITAALLLVLAPAALALAGCSPQPGACESGTLIDAHSSEDVFHCRRSCVNNPGCGVYTYFPDSQVCMEYSECSSVSGESCVDACQAGSSQCHCLVPGSCTGHQVGIDFPGNEYDCGRSCRANSACLWWSFDPADNICLLFSNCSAISTEICPQCVSGETICPDILPNVLFNFGGTGSGSGWNPFYDASFTALNNEFRIECPQLGVFEQPTLGASGFVHEGHPVICAQPECLLFNLTSWQWQAFPDLGQPRKRASGIQLGQDWLLTGGRNGSSFDDLNSYDFYDNTLNSFTSASGLPMPISSHCIAQINASHAVLSGGSAGNQSFLLDITTQSWTQLPDMTRARSDHACGLATSSSGSSYYIAATGYVDDFLYPECMDYYFRTVDVLDLSTWTWSQGVDVPYVCGMVRPGYTPFEDSFLVVGGMERHGGSWDVVFTYDADNATMPWQQLPASRSSSDSVVLTLSLDMLANCEITWL